jgi:hypothetical protein
MVAEEGDGMTTEAVDPRTAEAGLFLPADGLSLLGEHQDSGCAGRRFLIGKSDGQVIQLPLLLYLIMAAVAEGGVDGGWSAGQVGTRVGAASGQGLAAENVRYLIAGKLVPLGLIAADGTARPVLAPSAAPAHPARLLLSRLVTGPVARVLRRCRRRRWALALGGTAVLVSVAAAAPIMTGTGTGNRNPETSATTSASAAPASQSQAAAWVAQQVSPDVTVSCDPSMCGQLRRDRFPAARLKALPPGARVLSPGVVVATPDIRRQFGSRLDAPSASQVIASFGSGTARVDIRTIAPAHAKAFNAEQATLASVGRQMLGNKNIRASTSAQAALRAGRVDARLLAILSLLSGQMPVHLLGFTGAPGAGPGTPLREAEVGVTSSATRSAVVALLDAQQSPYRPVVVADGSRLVVALRFEAPASLDLSQP